MSHRSYNNSVMYNTHADASRKPGEKENSTQHMWQPMTKKQANSTFNPKASVAQPVATTAPTSARGNRIEYSTTNDGYKPRKGLVTNNNAFCGNSSLNRITSAQGSRPSSIDKRMREQRKMFNQTLQTNKVLMKTQSLVVS